MIQPTMEEKKTEGLLLQAIPYLGNQKILKVLTKKEGLLSFFVKKKELLNLANPFLKAEWVYTSGKGDIHPLKDISSQDTFEALRRSFPLIQTAGQIAQSLLKTQLPGKCCVGIYTLTIAFFKRLPEFSNPETLLMSFYLKTLLHDGLLSLETVCDCGKKADYLGSEGSHCSAHQKSGSIFFTPEQWEQLHILAFARKFQLLQDLKTDQRLQENVERLFYHSLNV